MMPKHTFTAGAVVLNPQGLVLVVNQKGTSWSLPKGHIEDGEDAKTAAIREIEEESGLTQLEFIADLGSYQRHKIGKTGGDDTSELKTITMFLCRTSETKLNPLDPENPEARWVPPEQVANFLTHPKDKQFFLNALPIIAMDARNEIPIVQGSLLVTMDTNQVAPWAIVPSPYKYSMDTIILPHQLDSLESDFKALGHKWIIKNEFHVSLITIKKIVPLVIQNNDIAEEAVLGLVMNVTNKVLTSHKPQFLKFTGEFRIATKADRKTLVAMCEVSNLDKLYANLCDKLNIEVEVPPTHITLYTLENRKAIGHATDADINSLTTIISGNKLRSIKTKMNLLYES